MAENTSSKLHPLYNLGNRDFVRSVVIGTSLALLTFILISKDFLSAWILTDALTALLDLAL
ncbi:hypothetical protein BD408DRAFT_424442 [Parasitella parasitica]|nr:hypothetical protein BD408DRAFT_424442 [Parasitella parasitica]